jgi:hypothetical protein
MLLGGLGVLAVHPSRRHVAGTDSNRQGAKDAKERERERGGNSVGALGALAVHSLLVGAPSDWRVAARVGR